MIAPLRMRRPLPLAALAMWIVWGASGCGQKGALYLPDRAPQTVPAPATAPAANAAPAASAPPAAAVPEDQAKTRKTPRIPDPVTAQ
jgi:predicted small lipoprotein YifL